MVKEVYEELPRTRWNDIFGRLKECGFRVFPPATERGECKRPYVVVSLDGGEMFSGTSTAVDYYEIACIVPEDRYTILEAYVAATEEAIKPLAPMIQNEYEKQPSFYDPDMKAHIVTYRVRNYKKKEGIMPKGGI